MKIALIDNYDSFTYNLFDYLCRSGAVCDVYRNDAVSIQNLKNYDAFVLSPGPKRPEDAGLLMDIVDAFCEQKPMLGVCLGHQAIGMYFGADLQRAEIPVHGKSSMIHHGGTDIFLNLENPMQVMRYHSLLLNNLPYNLQPLAYTNEGALMAMRHSTLPLWGVQFHPESILTPLGLTLMNNWLILVKTEMGIIV